MKAARFAALALLAALCVPAGATDIQPVYGTACDGDPRPQRCVVHDYVVQLAERMFWMPDSMRIYNGVSWDELPSGICGQALVEQTNKDVAGSAYQEPLWLLKLKGTNTEAVQRDGSQFQFQYSDTTACTSEADFLSMDPPGGQVRRGLHEIIHLLGFASINLASSNAVATLYDSHLRLADGTQAYNEMSEATRVSLTAENADVRWQGAATVQAVMDGVVTAGMTDGRVLLDTSTTGAYRSHLSTDVVPPSIMEPTPASEGELDLGIVAYMLSDLGWGEVVDSSIGDIADIPEPTDGNNETVLVNVPVNVAVLTGGGIANRVVVHVTPPTSPPGLEVTGTNDMAIANCPGSDPDIGSFCIVNMGDGMTLIPHTLGGAPGIYQVTVDVEHEEAHIDPRPANNFQTFQVTVGRNTIGSIRGPSVPRGTAADVTLTGSLVVTPGGDGVTHTFALAAGEGDTHNACFNIVNGNQLQTDDPISGTGLPASSLSIRVAATASNGFTNTLAVPLTLTGTATATATASVWTWSTAALADAGAEALSLRGLALAGLLVFVAGYALGGDRRRRQGHRIALATAVLLLAASCGGGGGGGGGGAPPPPPPPPPTAFSCT